MTGRVGGKGIIEVGGEAILERGRSIGDTRAQFGKEGLKKVKGSSIIGIHANLPAEIKAYRITQANRNIRQAVR